MTLRRFVHSGNGPRRKAALASSQFHERGATDPATRWRRTVLLSAAGIMARTLGAVAFLGLPRALAQTEPGTPPEQRFRLWKGREKKWPRCNVVISAIYGFLGKRRTHLMEAEVDVNDQWMR